MAFGSTQVVVAVVVVIAIALMMGAGSKKDEAGDGASGPGPRPEADDAADAGDADDEPHVVAVTSEGEAFVGYQHAVLLVPPEDEGEAWKVGAGLRAGNLRGERALGMSWQAGELTGVRVVQGGADEGPWRFEALGRDGEYLPYPFETREGAEAARQLFERMGIVRLGEDEDGNPMPPSAEQFAEARRMFLATMAELDAEDPHGA